MFYDEAYFLRGQETGKSLYKDYRWLPDLTIPMVRSLIQTLSLEPHQTICDFGCARGYVVRAFRELGFCNVFGIDASEWAVTNADPSVKEFVKVGLRLGEKVDWVIAKDVLEHVPNLLEVIYDFHAYARTGFFVVVPLSPSKGEPYEVPEYEKDLSHLHRMNLCEWLDLLRHPEWDVEGVYRLPGIKDNYAAYARGNGFIRGIRKYA